MSLDDISSLSNAEVSEKLISVVGDERQIAVEILRYLREVERRQIFVEIGFSSLFSYCVGHLKYSESAAQRRIVAMRALREIPELEEYLLSGELSLSVIALTRSALRGAKLSREEVKEVYSAVCGLSRREAERILVENFDLATARIESAERPLKNGALLVMIEFTKEEAAEIEELHRLRSQPVSTKELILSLVRAEVAKRKRALGEAPLLRNRVGTADGGSRKSRRTVVRAVGIGRSSNGQARIRRLVWQRAGGRCEHLDQARIRCSAERELEFDHVHPRAYGGGDGIGNLRLLCRAHHRWITTVTFGESHMKQFRIALR